jgi:3',5'-cyclic AMP phosphodiesterase CpdA
MKKNRILVCFLILSLLTMTACGVWAVPLSQEQNLRKIGQSPFDPAVGFNFVVVGDTRDGADVFNRLLAQAGDRHPLFILHSGDFVKKGTSSELESYALQIAAIPIPMVHVPGNHDINNGYDDYFHYVGEPNWFLDVGNIRLIGLDNSQGKFSPEALVMARKALTDQKICMVVFHHPPAIGRWSVHAMASDQNSGDTREVMELIKKAKSPLVFMGHIHLYDEMEIDGTHYIITAGGGAKLHKIYNFGKAEHGFLLVQVRPNGITHQWIPLK